MFMTKKQAQLLLLAAGVLMLLFGVWRGEADTVFSNSSLSRQLTGTGSLRRLRMLDVRSRC